MKHDTEKLGAFQEEKIKNILRREKMEFDSVVAALKSKGKTVGARTSEMFGRKEERHYYLLSGRAVGTKVLSSKETGLERGGYLFYTKQGEFCFATKQVQYDESSSRVFAIYTLLKMKDGHVSRIHFDCHDIFDLDLVQLSTISLINDAIDDAEFARLQHIASTQEITF